MLDFGQRIGPKRPQPRDPGAGHTARFDGQCLRAREGKLGILLERFTGGLDVQLASLCLSSALGLTDSGFGALEDGLEDHYAVPLRTV